MSGTILISEKKNLPLSTLTFDYLVERIRVAFKVDYIKYREEIYSPLDDGGMTFISLKDQEVKAFRAFCNATERAYSEASNEEGFPRYEDMWRTLLEMLKSDPRYGTA
jgi:hypothetical protein